MTAKVDELLAELAASEDDVSWETLADAWIVFGAQPVDAGFVALAGNDIAARAVCHLAEGATSPLAEASSRFLAQLVAARGRDQLSDWIDRCRDQLDAAQLDAAVVTLNAALAQWAEGQDHAAVIAGARSWRVLLDRVTEDLVPDVLLDAAADVAAHHPDLEADASRLRALLAVVAKRNVIVHGIAGQPRHVMDVDDYADSISRQARIAGEAIATIWDEPMLEPHAAAVALGVKPSNREKVRSYRDRSWLLGLPHGRGYVYPAFQFDPRRKDVHTEVREANMLLRASEDPWGVASWWISLNARLGARPCDLVGTPRAGTLVEVAGAVVEPVG